MSAQVLFRGPLPPEGGQWCTVCFMMAKAEAISSEDGQAKIKAAAVSEDSSKVLWVTVKPSGVLAEAVTTGISPPLQQFGVPVPVPLCWSHAMGVVFKDGGILPASAGQMPPGGVPLLGQRNGR